ncbi:uncharacterized protein LOC126377779 [Pectinophora gossypiella]|uniref:uncharacterized protein LOC126377779 n=1 Tax=Pectinophora gossypiella TaxID=13191 RepID=UPI00214F26D0|nr:uncharacterized protein LOC126377779 [Pectinophora gossypiella]
MSSIYTRMLIVSTPCVVVIVNMRLLICLAVVAVARGAPVIEDAPVEGPVVPELPEPPRQEPVPPQLDPIPPIGDPLPPQVDPVPLPQPIDPVPLPQPIDPRPLDPHAPASESLPIDPPAIIPDASKPLEVSSARPLDSEGDDDLFEMEMLLLLSFFADPEDWELGALKDKPSALATFAAPAAARAAPAAKLPPAALAALAPKAFIRAEGEAAFKQFAD